MGAVSCVPWLAAEGPLGYTPENPPATDYFFQYGWILPEIFGVTVHKRCHYYFGTPNRDHARPLFEFWKQARRREIDRVYLSLACFIREGADSVPAGADGNARSRLENAQRRRRGRGRLEAG
jgi:hypothetical protein